MSLFPKPPDIVLSDNGREFEAGFAEALAERGIRRWYTYPKTPKMNAHAERFNRTLQESFVDDHEDLLFTDLALFNRKPTEWLVFTNTERPHQGLDQQSPLSFTRNNQNGITIDQASTDLDLYPGMAPGNTVYDKSARAYVRDDRSKTLFLKPDPASYLSQLRLISDGIITHEET